MTVLAQACLIRLDGATPGQPATHVTFEQSGDFDLNIWRRAWDTTYSPDLGS